MIYCRPTVDMQSRAADPIYFQPKKIYSWEPGPEVRDWLRDVDTGAVEVGSTYTVCLHFQKVIITAPSTSLFCLGPKAFPGRYMVIYVTASISTSAPHRHLYMLSLCMIWSWKVDQLRTAGSKLGHQTTINSA